MQFSERECAALRLAVPSKRNLILGAFLAVPALSDRSDAGSQVDQAVVNKDVGRRFFVDRRQHAQMRHHEDAVHRERGEPQRFVGVHHHQHGLDAPWRMGQDAAAADDQVQLEHVNQAPAGGFLFEDIRDRPLLLDALEAGRQRFVVDERQPESFARNGLLDLQFVQRLRDGRRTDHLVLDAVAQGLFVQVERHPPHDVGEAGFGQHVRDAVGHAEVGADRAIEDAAIDREHIRGGAADVHADQIDLIALG